MRRLGSCFFLCVFLIFSNTTWAGARFSDIYAEALYQQRTQTTSGDLQTRVGWQDSDQRFQLYLMGQLRGDNHTLNSSYSQVYNDNYAAGYLGMDMITLPGVRFSSQLGVSKDLTDKIHLAGLELNFGFITYHEIPFTSPRLHAEIYSEELYIRRYRNFLPSGHFTFYGDLFQWGESIKWTIAPAATLKASFDSKKLNYNRFVEEQFGARFQVRSSTLSSFINPHFVVGQNLMTPGGVLYPEFRILWVFGWYF